MEGVNPWGHCSEGFNTLPLGSSGDGFHEPFRTGDTLDWVVTLTLGAGEKS